MKLDNKLFVSRKEEVLMEFNLLELVVITMCLIAIVKTVK